MTTDEKLTALRERLRLAAERAPYNPALRDVLDLADALAETRAIAFGPAFDAPPTLTFRDPLSDKTRTITIVPAPRPTEDTPETWRAAIRASLAPLAMQQGAFDRAQHVECLSCATKPGSPTLCASCLANRLTIGELRTALRRAIDLAREHYAAAYGGDVLPGEHSIIDALEKVLVGH